MSEKDYQELQAKLDKLIVDNQLQADYGKRAWIMSVISGVCVIIMSLVVLLSVVILGPRINSILNQAETSLVQLNSILGQLQDTLDETDIVKMSDEITELISETRVDLEIAFDSISKIDFDSLNSAIKNLSAVIEPLSKFFSTFGKY